MESAAWAGSPERRGFYKENMMAKTLPISVANGVRRVVLDRASRNRLDAAIGICAQVMMGEEFSPNAGNAKAAVRAMQAIIRNEDKVVVAELIEVPDDAEA